MKKLLSTKRGKIIFIIVAIFLLVGIFGDNSANELKELKQVHEALERDMDSLQADYDVLIAEKAYIEQRLTLIPEEILEQLDIKPEEGQVIELYAEGEPDRAALLKENETLTQTVIHLEEENEQLKKDNEQLEEVVQQSESAEEQALLEEQLRIEEIAAQEAEAAAQSASQIQSQPETEAETTPVEVTVHITNTGSKYHRSGCSYLKSDIPISLSEAQSRGYSACSRCY